MTLFRRVLLFVGIAWSIAGAFQLLSNGGPWLLYRAASAGWVPGWLMDPRVQQPVDCSGSVQGMQTRELDETTLRGTRVAAYQLGFDLGLYSGARNAGSRVQEPPSLLPGAEIGSPASSPCRCRRSHRCVGSPTR